jgi:hypothetical protein
LHTDNFRCHCVPQLYLVRVYQKLRYIAITYLNPGRPLVVSTMGDNVETARAIYIKKRFLALFSVFVPEERLSSGAQISHTNRVHRRCHNHSTPPAWPSRRQIQLQSAGAMAIGTMAKQIMAQEGIGGFYRGFLPSAVKNLPNKGAARPRIHKIQGPGSRVALQGPCCVLPGRLCWIGAVEKI